MVLNILIFSLTFEKRHKIGQIALLYFGIIPGFLGVVWAIVLFFKQPETTEIIGLLSVWLLLEVRAFRLTQVIKKLNQLARSTP
jgi:putative effector of murein hydrolase LrgA (UPF0299 family)